MADEKYMDFYTKSEIDAMLNGLTFIKMAKEDFDALETKDPNTNYYVYDENGDVKQYLGDVELSSGSGVSIGNPVGQLGGVIGGVIGAAEEV